MASQQGNTADTSLLDALPPVVSALARKGIIRRYRANTTLIEEDDHGDSVFIVLSGLPRTYCANHYGKLTRLPNSLGVEHRGDTRVIPERLTHLSISKRVACTRESKW